MNKDKERKIGPALETQAIRAKAARTEHREHSPPIFLSSSFVFDSAQQAAEVFANDQPGYVYSRYTNPTVTQFENRLQVLEKADFCLATASGMSALLALLHCELQPGDRMVSARQLFHTSRQLFDMMQLRMGIEIEFVDAGDVQAWRRALSRKAKLAFLEVPTNPLLAVADLDEIATLCRNFGVRLAVDNTFATAVQFRPLEYGADWSVVSATKWLDGQGRCVGGALLGRAEAEDRARNFMRICGPSMSAFDAWVMLKGLETLPLRVQSASRTAFSLAQWLDAHQAEHQVIERIFYPGLQQHSTHAAATRLLDGYGAVLSLRLKGGKKAAWRFIDASKILSITANLGDTRSTITHPASTTHRSVPADQKQQDGIADGLVRIAVGLEALEDLKQDLLGCCEAVQAL